MYGVWVKVGTWLGCIEAAVAEAEVRGNKIRNGLRFFTKKNYHCRIPLRPQLFKIYFRNKSVPKRPHEFQKKLL